MAPSSDVARSTVVVMSDASVTSHEYAPTLPPELASISALASASTSSRRATKATLAPAP